MDNEIVYLFKLWRDTPTQNCCTHLPSQGGHYDSSGHPLPNDQVCPRERAWREYVVKRDGLNGEYISLQRANKTKYLTKGAI